MKIKRRIAKLLKIPVNRYYPYEDLPILIVESKQTLLIHRVRGFIPVNCYPAGAHAVVNELGHDKHVRYVLK